MQTVNPSETPLLLLVHGWGLGPGLWRPLIRALPDCPCHTLDLGFFGRPCLVVPPHRPLLAVGHSLGFLWLLHHLEQAPWRDQCVGLVSMAGFSRFSRADHFPAGIPPRFLARMRQRLPMDAAGVLKAFSQQSGWSASSVEVVADPAPLLAGLDWLESWDGRAPLAAWRGPLHSMAARDDQIVPPALTTACFAPHTIHWVQAGGHLLPLTRPDACAAYLRHRWEEVC